MTCQWQTGLLVMQECGGPASGACSLCGRLVCASHTLMGQAGPACPQCASTREDYPENDDTELAESRSEYYTPYGGAAAFGDDNYFSQADTAALGAVAGGASRPISGQLPQYDPTET